MWSWLTWLWGKATRVYNLVAAFYSQIISAAQSAWTWARNARDQAISWALDKIIYYYYRAKSAAAALVQGVFQLALTLYTRAIEAAQALFAGVGALVNIGIDRAIAGAQALINGIRDLAWALYAKALKAAQAIKAGLLGIIAASVERAYQAALAIINGMVGAIDATLKRAGIVDPEDEDQLRLFLTNPMDFFAAYLVAMLLTALDYLLGYALGTVAATLPPPPEWSTNGRGGPVPPGPGPLPGSSPLAPPLSYLRRSGYYYTPSHRAADFGCTADMAVFACHDGKVLVAGWSNVGYGNYVVIGNGEWWSLYAHLSTLGIRTGESVDARDPIGLCDCTGNSTCNHLHLELKHYGSFVSPYVVFGVEG